MTAPARPRPAATDPAVDLRLARLHLRMGQLGLARAALEVLAGSGNLDGGGLVALAEARWRTGDLAGAGQAAQAYLAAGGQATVAFVIAAESIAAAGRPGEARRLAARVLERADVSLDRVFAGSPRSDIWPADRVEAAIPAGTLFGDGRPGAQLAVHGRADLEVAHRIVADARLATDEETGPGLWDVGAPIPDLPDPAAELAACRAGLDAGRRAEVAIRLALVLRRAPELAAAVLEATDPLDRRSAEIDIVRGDAFRLVGHELDARRAWAAAAAELRDRTASGGGSDPQPPQPPRKETV